MKLCHSKLSNFEAQSIDSRKKIFGIFVSINCCVCGLCVLSLFKCEPPTRNLWMKNVCFVCGVRARSFSHCLPLREYIYFAWKCQFGDIHRQHTIAYTFYTQIRKWLRAWQERHEERLDKQKQCVPSGTHKPRFCLLLLFSRFIITFRRITYFRVCPPIPWHQFQYKAHTTCHLILRIRRLPLMCRCQNHTQLLRLLLRKHLLCRFFYSVCVCFLW